MLIAILVSVFLTGPAEFEAELYAKAASARTVADMADLARLVRMVPEPADSLVLSDCGFRAFEPPGFYYLEASASSGILSSEVFVFQGSRTNLRLRAHLPFKTSVWRRAEWVNDKLVISEHGEAENSWQPVIELLP